ncbi:MAG: MauE/DoxX family redox-associated membrane protein [Gemmatimonadota bacterium]
MENGFPALPASVNLVATAWLGLVTILLASAIGKLYYKGSVKKALQRLGIHSELFRDVVSATLAPLELLIAVWLASGWLAAWSTHAALTLVVVFNVVLWRLMVLGFDGACGCFGGKSAGPVRAIHLVRNALMLVAAIYLALATSHHEGVAGPIWAIPGAVLLQAVLVLAGLLVVYLLAGAAERLLFRAYWR